jgi:hypothetical protein
MTTRIVAKSPKMIQAIGSAQHFARTSSPILLIGNRGTGKDFFAELTHKLQGRQVFRKVNCSQSNEMLRRELLGYFDALQAQIAFEPEEAYHPGVLERASSGTIYLDRIDLTPRSCVRLLVDLMQGKPYTPIGTSRTFQQRDILFVASCEQHPFAKQVEGYLDSRLRVIFGSRILAIPALKERRTEIPELVKQFLDEIAPNLAFELCEDFLQSLSQYDWPGNLRDLRRIALQIPAELPRGGKVTSSVMQKVVNCLQSRPAESSEYVRRHRCSILAEGLVYQNMPVDGDRLYAWIDQFNMHRGSGDLDPRDVAEELLKAIRNRFFYNGESLRCILENLYQKLLSEVRQIPYWRQMLRSPNRRGIRILQNQMIVSNPLGIMKSPDAVNLIFRSVSGLTPGKNAVEFDHISDHIRKKKGGTVVVFVDDFIGSGQQFEEQILRRLISDNRIAEVVRTKSTTPVNFFMLVCVAYDEGLERARKALQAAPSWLEMSILVGDILGKESKAFSQMSQVFPIDTIRCQAEEILVGRIGQHLHPAAPQGWNDMQSLIVFGHNTPNCTLPVIWKNGYVGERLWHAIFPRMGAS